MADPKLEATCTALHAVLLSNFHLNGHSRLSSTDSKVRTTLYMYSIIVPQESTPQLSFEWSHDFKDLVHLLKCLTCTA